MITPGALLERLRVARREAMVWKIKREALEAAAKEPLLSLPSRRIGIIRRRHKRIVVVRA